MNHRGKRLFITGIPTSGKSHLAQLLAEKTSATVVHLDNMRIELSTNTHYAQWTNFFLNRDEKKYITQTNQTELWNNLVLQSEGLWPAFLEKIESYADEEKPVIFECVNILPHLARRDLNFPGIVLIGSSFKEILERNIRNPRWGTTLELQSLEATMFFEIERPHYKAEAEKYGYQVFERSEDALDTALNLLK